MSDTTKHDLIAEAMEIVGCSREAIDMNVKVIKKFAEKAPLSETRLRQDALALANLLKKTQKALSRMPRMQLDAIREYPKVFKGHISGCNDEIVKRFGEDLDAENIKRDLHVLQQCCEIDADMMPKWRSGGANTVHKWITAVSAANLLQDAGKRLTLYKDGDYFTLASLLFEAATGKRGVDLRRQCEEIVHVRRSSASE